MPERIVIALGGNALQDQDSPPTAEAQLEVVKKTCAHIAEISRRGYEMAVVHGNGPQVGRIVLAGEAARDVVPPMPFFAHAAASLFGTACVACLVGVVESVMARLRMHVVPALVGLAGSVAAFVLILTLVR